MSYSFINIESIGATEGHIFIKAQAICTSLSNVGSFCPFRSLKSLLAKFEVYKL